MNWPAEPCKNALNIWLQAIVYGRGRVVGERRWLDKVYFD